MDMTGKGTGSSRVVTKRIGGRGCPSCGSHNTSGLGKGQAQWCDTCNFRWVPCSPGCRGYDCLIPSVNEDFEPQILGCEGCGVPNEIARKWPEAWRAVAKRLDGQKLVSVLGE